MRHRGTIEPSGVFDTFWISAFTRHVVANVGDQDGMLVHSCWRWHATLCPQLGLWLARCLHNKLGVISWHWQPSREVLTGRNCYIVEPYCCCAQLLSTAVEAASSPAEIASRIYAVS